MSGEIRMFSAKLPCSQNTALPVQTLQRQFNKNCFLREAASSPDPSLLQWMPRCFIYVQWKHGFHCGSPPKRNSIKPAVALSKDQQLVCSLTDLFILSCGSDILYYSLFLCAKQIQLWHRGLTLCCLVGHRQNCSSNLELRLSRVTCVNQKKFSRCVIVNESRIGGP